MSEIVNCAAYTAGRRVRDVAIEEISPLWLFQAPGLVLSGGLAGHTTFAGPITVQP
jgi:hypothetical protein